MQQENFEYLTRALAKLGFDGVLDEPLRTAMTLGSPEIKLSAQMELQPGNSMQFDFFFKHNVEKDRYYLNNVFTTLNKANAEPIKHDFFLYRQQGYDIREMKNMLEGRAVYTQYRNEKSETVELWRKIDFTSKDERQNNVVRSFYDFSQFKLEEQLKKIPFAGLNRGEKESILNDLKRGDKIGAVLKKGADKEVMYLLADPEIRLIQVFDQKGEKVNLNTHQMKVISEGKDNKNLPDATKAIADAQQQQQQEQGQQQGQGTRRKAS